MLEYAKICRYSAKDMAQRGYPTAPAGWYLQIKRGPVTGYLRLANDSLDDQPSILPARYNPRSGEPFYTRIRSRRARR